MKALLSSLSHGLWLLTLYIYISINIIYVKSNITTKKKQRECETVGFLDKMDRASNVVIPGEGWDESHRFETHFICLCHCVCVCVCLNRYSCSPSALLPFVFLGFGVSGMMGLSLLITNKCRQPRRIINILR